MLLVLIGSAFAWEHSGMVWSAEEGDIVLHLADGPGRPDGWVEGWEAAVATWNAVECGAPDVVIGSTDADNSTDGDEHRVLFDDPEGIVPSDAAGSTLLMSGGRVERNGVTYALVQQATAIFNDGYEFSDVLDEGCVDTYGVEAVASHLLGHVLGLGHSCEEGETCTEELSEATMYWEFVPCDVSAETLTDDDIAGLRALYGPRVHPFCGYLPEANVAPLALDCTLEADRVDTTAPRWDFGDGTTAEGASASHTYTEPGTYTLEVCGASTDDECLGDEVCGQEVFVVCGVPAPAFEVLNQSGLTVSFENTTPDPEVCIESWFWLATDAAGEEVARGDGATGFTIEFPSAGTWTVSLSAFGVAGDATTTLDIEVREPVAPAATETDGACACDATSTGGVPLALALGGLGWVRRRR